MSKMGIPFASCWLAVAGVLISSTFYTFPRAVALSVSTAAPWSILLSAGTMLLMFWPVGAMLARRPGKNLIDLALAAGGRPLAIVFALLLGGFFLLAAGLTLRQVSEMVVTALYPHTPQTFAMSGLIIVAMLGALMSPQGAVWLNSLYTLPVLGAILLVLVGNLGWGQWRNVLPLTGHGLLPVAVNLIPLTSHFHPLIYLAIYSTCLGAPRLLVRGAAYALGTATAVYTAVILLFMMVFPLPGGLDVPFPLFEMTRLVQGGRHFERFDALWIIFWAFGSAGRISMAIQATALLFQGAFRLPTHRDAVLPLTIAVLSAALFPSNQAGAVNLETFLIRRWGFLLVPLLPLLMALLAMYRTRTRQPGGSHHA